MTHPRAGEPTYFVEKIWASLYLDGIHLDPLNFLDVPFDARIYNLSEPKGHTIRAGNRWKVGDFFSPRIWSGKPYRSPQVIFSAPLMVAKIWSFELFEGYRLTVEGHDVGAFCNDNPRVMKIGCNDGLGPDDFVNWFSLPYRKKPATFVGQIICWNPRLEYNFLTPNK